MENAFFFLLQVLATIKSGWDVICVYSCTSHAKCNLLDEKMLIHNLFCVVVASTVCSYLSKEEKHISTAQKSRRMTKATRKIYKFDKTMNNIKDSKKTAINSIITSPTKTEKMKGN